MNSTYKKIGAAVAVVVLVGAFMYWGTGFIYDLTRGQSSEEREALITEIENNQKILESRTEIDYSLEQQVKDAEYELDLKLEEFPEDVDIPELVNEMLKLADENSITIIPLRTTSWAAAPRSGYQVYRFQIQVNGNVDDILSFITDVENSNVSSAVTTSLQLSSESIGDAGQSWAARSTLTVSVYRRA